MKPFYRVLTYLVLIAQSFIILLLLAEKQKDDCAYAAGSPVTRTASKAVSGYRKSTAWPVPVVEEIQLPSWQHKR
jgi:hypothetical protein